MGNIIRQRSLQNQDMVFKFKTFEISYIFLEKTLVNLFEKTGYEKYINSSKKLNNMVIEFYKFLYDEYDNDKEILEILLRANMFCKKCHKRRLHAPYTGRT